MKAGPSVKTPAQYIATLPEDRRAAVRTIHRAIVKAAPKLKPFVIYGMIGYGKFHYKYPSGREGDWAVVGLASQKNHLSLYLCCADQGGYLAEQNKARLGKVSVGRACVRFKKLADLNLPVALELVKKASGLIGKDGGSFVL